MCKGMEVAVLLWDPEEAVVGIREGFQEAMDLEMGRLERSVLQLRGLHAMA